MRPGTFRMLAPAAALAIAATAQAAPVASDLLINFGSVAGAAAGSGKEWQNIAPRGPVYNWFGSATNDVGSLQTTANSNTGQVLLNRSFGATDLNMMATNWGGFFNADRGNGVSQSYGGQEFYGHLNTSTQPNNPMQSYLADNLTASRDGLTVFRFVSGEQYHFKFTVVSSYHNLADGDPPATGQTDLSIETLFNIGGAYSAIKGTTNTGSFTDGTTISVDPTGNGNYDWGAGVIEGNSIWNASLNKYVIDLQMGVGSKGNLALINAMRVETSVIPEPATAAIAGVVSAVLILGRRRQCA